MNEAEWLASEDPKSMLVFVQHDATPRKLRLFAVACCRQAWRLAPPNVSGERAILVNERYADRLATQEELKAARRGARSCELVSTRIDAYEAAAEAAKIAGCKVRSSTFHSPGGARKAERVHLEQDREQSILLRDIFGNSFHPVQINEVWLRWNDGTIPKIAQTIYDDRELPSGTLGIARMGILADALEEAGCADPQILDHLRGPGPHVRGCFVLDLLTGKS